MTKIKKLKSNNMKPIKFELSNAVLGANQKGVQPLQPILVSIKPLVEIKPAPIIDPSK